MEKNEHYLYVLSCRDGSLYAGYTNNLEKRLKLHNEGKGAKYTRGRGPVKLVYVKDFETKSDALKAEYAFKQMTRAKKNDFLTSELGGNDAATEEL